MGLFTSLPLPDAQRLAAEYGLSVVEVEPLTQGSVNSNFRLRAADGRVYFARLYEEQGAAGAAAELRLLEELAVLGVPTTVPVRRKQAGAASFAGKPFAIYPWVDGTILCQAQVTADHCRALGSALAELHCASDKLGAIPEGRFRAADLCNRLDNIEATDARFRQAAQDVRARLTRLLAERSEGLPEGITHGDLFRDNVLWQQGRIAALIDFESAARGPFVYDLMVCVHAWCYGDAFELALVQALVEGYCTTRSLSAQERAALRTEGALAALRFATTRITDFAMRAAPGTTPARDYRRFLARQEALERGELDAALRLGA